MADGRMIKKEIRKSQKIARLKNDKARSLYFMIYPHVDVEGRLSAETVDIKAECIPLFNWAEKTIEKAISDLNKVGLIILFQKDEQKFLQVVRFHDFQKIKKDREKQSKIPAPEDSGVIRINHEKSA